MGKRVKIKQARQYTPIQITLLVIKFSLIKLGEVPVSLVRRAKDRLSQLPNFSLVTFHLPRLRRGRGRPTKPLTFQILKKRLKSHYNSLPRKFRVALVFTILLAIFFSYTVLTFQAAYSLPNPARLTSTDKPLTTEFYDRSGTLLYRIYEGRNRTLVDLKELPAFVAQATIAIEDKNFYHHPGIDPVAIARALYHNITQQKMEGASTLTQQLIKNTLLTPEKTFGRKLKEMILAFWAERIYSKNEILSMYLNEAPYGGPAWGIEAASQVYFGQPAVNLDLAQAAYLAGLPASPTQFSPYGTNPDLGKTRQAQVLARMREDGYITTDQEQQAINEVLNIQPPSTDIKAPHFVMYLKDLLNQKYGVRAVSQGGLKVYTTLDLNLQEQVEKIVAQEVENLAPLKVSNGAAMVLDGKTGQILAMVGSRGWGYPGFGNFNVAISLRQPGSAIKVVTYSAAFSRGFSPGNTVLDTPVTFKDGINPYSPLNYDGNYHGPVSIRQALGSSYNIPAVKMLATIGLDTMLQEAKDLGITTFNQPQRYGLSLTLGGAEVKMIDMMAVYDTLSQMGQRRPPTGILKVTDPAGNILEDYQDKSQQVIRPEVAYLITNILSDNSARTPAFGSNSLLQIPGFEVGVKTGTSDSKRDNWTFGYTPDYVVGVWVGNNDNTPMNPQLTSGVTGATPIWNQIMHALVDNKPNVTFIKPMGVIEKTVDGRRDLAISDLPAKSMVRVRTEADEQSSTGYKTIFSDAFSSFVTPSASRPAEQAAIKDGSAN